MQSIVLHILQNLAAKQSLRLNPMNQPHEKLEERAMLFQFVINKHQADGWLSKELFLKLDDRLVVRLDSLIESICECLKIETGWQRTRLHFKCQMRVLVGVGAVARYEFLDLPILVCNLIDVLQCLHLGWVDKIR